MPKRALITGSILIRLAPPASVRGAGSQPGATDRALCAGYSARAAASARHSGGQRS